MEQVDLLRYAVAALEKLAIPYMLVGSFASTAYGEPRFTHDIDIVVDLPLTDVAAFCRAFPPPDFFLNEDAVRQAVATHFQFNVLHPSSGNKIDFMLPRTDEWGKMQLERRQKIQLLPGCDGFAARPEDVILGKLWYYAEGGSEKHLRDIIGMLQIDAAKIDREYISQWANHLGVADVWQAVLERVSPAKS